MSGESLDDDSEIGEAIIGDEISFRNIHNMAGTMIVHDPLDGESLSSGMSIQVLDDEEDDGNYKAAPSPKTVHPEEPLLGFGCFRWVLLLLFLAAVGIGAIVCWQLGLLGGDDTERGSNQKSGITVDLSQAPVTVTRFPSPSPSMIPSPFPSSQPSTNNPAFRPTVSPWPSPSPSELPSPMPSVNPTFSPSPRPSDAPSTLSPTSPPTRGPTLDPTLSPTDIPTQAPTIAPTQRPTLRPTIFPITSRPTSLPDPNRLCNGLSTNCVLRVNGLMFATAHNAMSSKADNFQAPSNLEPLEDALQAGFRALTLDSCVCGLCNQFCWAGQRDSRQVFEAIVGFLQANLNEVVVIDIHNIDDTLDLLWLSISTIPGFMDLLYAHPGPGAPWPTLGELIDYGERLILFQRDGPSCGNPSACFEGYMHSSAFYMSQSPWELKNYDLLNPTLSCVVTDASEGDDFFMSNHFSKNVLGLPDSSVAAVMNQQSTLEDRIEACDGALDRLTNFLVVDFWSIETDAILGFVDEYNQNLAYFGRRRS